MAEAAQASRSAASNQQFHSYLGFLLQVSRPGLWSTTALFYLMPLGHADILHSGKLWLGLFFVLFPLGLLLYGVNDIVDAEADLLNPRKGTFMFGSRGAREQLAALKWQIAVVQIPFVTAFNFFVGLRILWWYALLLLAVGLYNAPGIAWKGRPPFDVLIQASYLLVFVLSSWLNNAQQLPWQTFLFGAMFAMHSHIFGEVMDIFFRDWIIAGFLAFGALWFLVDATLVWKNRAYSPREMRLFLWGWNAAALLGMFWNWTHGSLTHVVSGAGLCP